MAWRLDRRNRDEEGAVLPMTVVLTTVILLIAGIAVDLGLSRVARQDMQSLSTAVALDMVRNIDGQVAGQLCSEDGIPGPSEAWISALEASVARNNTTVGSTPDIRCHVGDVDTTTGEFVRSAPGAVPSAVQIIASTDVSYGISHVVRSEDGLTTTRSAVATMDEMACFSVGSFAASLNTSDSAILSLLDGVLGVDLRVLSPEGVAALRNAEVPLLGLAAALGVAGPDELLSTDITLLQFVDAAIEVLNNQGDTVAASALNDTIRAQVQALPDQIRIGDFLDLGAGGGSALALGVNALDLIGTGLVAASGGHAVQLPLNVNLSPLTNVSANVTVIAPPTIACGRPGDAIARSAQVQIGLSAGLLAIPGLSNIQLNLAIDVAYAEGRLLAMRCNAGPSGESSVLEIETTSGVVDTSLTLRTDVRLLLLPLVSATVRLNSSLLSRVDQVSLQIDPAPAPLPSHETGGATDFGLPPAGSGDVEANLLGIVPIGSVLNLVLPLVNGTVLPLVNGILMATLTTLLSPLGIKFGGATVSATNRPSCGIPALVG